MKKRTEIWISVIVGALLLCVIVWWQVYAFKDCKRVGHTTTYCIGRIGG